MSKKKSLLMSIAIILVIGLIITGGTFAYFQWSTGYEAGTSVNVTIEMGGITMHIEPEATEFVGLYPTADCTTNHRYGDALVTIVNNTGTLAMPSFKLYASINPSNDEGSLDYTANVHYAVVALETTIDAQGNPVKGEPIGGNYIDGLVTGSCKNPLSVSNEFDDGNSTYLAGNTFGDGGGIATDSFNSIPIHNSWTDLPEGAYLPREYNADTGKVSGVTFRGEAYSTSYQWYRVYVWIDEGYTTTIVGNTVSDPLQNAKINVTWSENSMLQQVSGESNVEDELVAGLYRQDGEGVWTWEELISNNWVTVSGTTITSSNIDIVDNGGHPYTTLVIPKEITMIGENAFKNQRIKGVAFEKNSMLTEIGAGAFSGSLITEIDLPSTLMFIRDTVFVDTLLTSLEIPSSVTYIGNTILGGVSITEISYSGTTEEWNNMSKHESWPYASGVAKVKCSDGEIDV